jgi:hypothetical protein
MPEDEKTERKVYNLEVLMEESGQSGAYRSRVTYQVKSQYMAKGKYHSKDDEF